MRATGARGKGERAMSRYRTGLPRPDQPVQAAPEWMPTPDAVPDPMRVQIKHNGREIYTATMPQHHTIEIRTSTGYHIVLEMDQNGRTCMQTAGRDARR